jgi:hypothetical protein
MKREGMLCRRWSTAAISIMGFGRAGLGPSVDSMLNTTTIHLARSGTGLCPQSGQPAGTSSIRGSPRSRSLTRGR